MALVGLVAGCAAGLSRLDTDSGAEPPAKAARTKPARVKVYVVAVDGDTGRRVRSATARVAAQRDRANRKGLSTLRVRRLAPLPVRVSAPGYLARTVRVPFHRHRQNTVRIYRRTLQWPMYGVTPGRTQAHPRIRMRPPFKVVWSRGIGSLIEFPAVVSEGVAYIANQKGMVYAISMRFGKTIWRFRPPHGKMASSPAVVGDELVVHGMEGNVWVLDRASGRLRWRYHVGSPIESSPIVRNGVDYFGAWNGVVYALDLKRQEAALDAPRGLQDHLERRHRRQAPLHRRLRRLRPLDRASHRAPVVGVVRGRAHLRHARARLRPRVRPVLDGRLGDGVLDHRGATSGG